MDVILRLTDEELTLISLVMEVGLAVMDEFNKLDFKEWGMRPFHLEKARQLVKELDDAVIYEYIVKNMGVE